MEISTFRPLPSTPSKTSVSGGPGVHTNSSNERDLAFEEL
jgi:hypothetical protein